MRRGEGDGSNELKQALWRCVHVAALFALAGCDAPREPFPAEREPAPVSPEARRPTTEITVFFTREELPHAVTREVPRSADMLTAALEALLQGPTGAEREEGVSSWFSEHTSHMLLGAGVDEEGHAVIDFADFRRVIPNASTSAGSQILLAELTGTVEQVEAVSSIEYQLEGSCHRFWVFLQRGCEILMLE